MKKEQLLGSVVGYVNENNNRPIYEVTKEIKVKLIDWTPIILKLKQDEELKDLDMYIPSYNGVVLIPSDKREEGYIPILIDKECCGIESEVKNLLVEGKVMCVDFFEGVGVFVRSKGFIPIMPKYYFDFDYDDIEKCFTGEEKELYEYMDGRYLYNPRIEKNMMDIIKLYRGLEIKSN